jgi:hypothetical protein
MLRRLILGCALACGLLATQATASAASAEARVLTGKTGQNYRIVVKADRRGLKIQRFNAKLNCRDGTLLILQESGFLRTPARRGGRFKDVQFGKTDTVRFRGRLRARSVRGKLRVNDKLNNGVRCSSRWIPFRATRRR